MNKAFDRIAVLPFETKAYEEGGEMYVEGLMTTNALDRVGEVMEMSGLKNWTEFKRNPILLWQHGDRIGHAIGLRKGRDGIWSKDQLARTRLVTETV